MTTVPLTVYYSSEQEERDQCHIDPDALQKMRRWSSQGWGCPIRYAYNPGQAVTAQLQVMVQRAV